MINYYKEGFLIQVIFYSGVWLISEYTGLLLCLLMSACIGSLLIFALVAELVQKSKVPKAYYKWMLLSSIAPAFVAIAFSLLYGGNFDWLG